jgi:hypothetical protein
MKTAFLKYSLGLCAVVVCLFCPPRQFLDKACLVSTKEKF